jgi:hypothetical protein
LFLVFVVIGCSYAAVSLIGCVVQIFTVVSTNGLQDTQVLVSMTWNVSSFYTAPSGSAFQYINVYNIQRLASKYKFEHLYKINMKIRTKT